MKRFICSMVGVSLLVAGVMVAGLVVGVESAEAQEQGLADLARQEQVRRKAIKRPVKVYTNDDVPVTSAATAGTSTEVSSTPKEGAAADGTAPGAQAGAQPGAAGQPGAAPTVSAGDEAKWRAKVTQAREQLSRAKMQLEGMRTRVAHLQTTKVLSGADPARQAQAQREQQDAKLEFDKLRGDVDRYTKALADVEAEARAANVPAGWLR